MIEKLSEQLKLVSHFCFLNHKINGGNQPQC